MKTAKEYVDELDESGEHWSNDTLAIIEALDCYAKYYHEHKMKELSQTKDLSKTCGFCVKPETKAPDNTVSCPICGTECNIMGEGETHYYLPKKEK